MVRKAHYLAPLKTARYPRELIAFDCETDPCPLDADTDEHILRFGWACHSRFRAKYGWSEPDWFRFESGHELWQWIEATARPKQQTYVYCHNVNFDWQATAMCQLLPSLGWQCTQAIIEDPPNAFRWNKDTKTLRCLDSFNYFYASLKQIGDRIGLPKLDMPDSWTDPKLSDDYCKRDALIVLRAIQEWIAWLRDHGLGSLAISLAAQSMNAYRYRFMDHPIFIDDNDKARKLERASYFGGRVEAWRVGVPVHSVTCLDINSMYPYLMREHTYPTKLKTVLQNATFAELERWLRHYLAVAEVTLTTDEPCYPLLGDGKLLFPVGTFRTTLCTPELSHAFERGRLDAIHSIALYDHAPIFRNYIDSLYDFRLGFMTAKDDAAVYFVKKLMNSNYGKWAQKGGFEEIIGYTDDLSLRLEHELDLDSGERFKLRYIAGVITRASLDGESRQSFPAISAHVTSHGRMLLWRYLSIAGTSHCYYSDTDSLHVDPFGLWNLLDYISPTELGALKCEKYIDHAIYYGPKDYYLSGAQTTKGIRAKARSVGRDEYEQEQFVSLRGSCLSGHSGGPLVRRVRKRLTRVYSKGIVDSTGRVIPFRR